MASVPPIAPDLSEVDTGDLSELWIDIGDGLVEVAEITDIPELPSGAQSTFETTHMKSGRFKEFKKNARKEGNEVAITGNYILGSDAEDILLAAEDARGALPYRIVAHQGEDVYHIDGYALFMNLQRSNPMDDRRQFTISAKWVFDATQTKAA